MCPHADTVWRQSHRVTPRSPYSRGRSFFYFCLFFFFFFNDTATTEIYTLSLHDLFRSSRAAPAPRWPPPCCPWPDTPPPALHTHCALRSEEHTSELQSPCNLVCRLL